MSFPVAVQVYSVRGAAEVDLYGTLKKIKAMGYDGVEFAGLYGNEPATVNGWCRELGLVPLSAHVPYPELVADPRGTLNKYKEVGCQFIAIPWLEEKDRPGGADFAKTVENVKLIGKIARELGMQLLYHNHDFEFVRIDGKYGLDVLYDSVDAELLASELDTCWVNVGGEEPAGYVRRFKGRAPVVHLKDFVGTKNENMYELIGVDNSAPVRPSDFAFRPVGSGVQDFPAILKAAEDAGALWVVVEQDRPTDGEDPMNEIKISIDYLRSIGV